MQGYIQSLTWKKKNRGKTWEERLRDWSEKKPNEGKHNKNLAAKKNWKEINRDKH